MFTKYLWGYGKCSIRNLLRSLLTQSSWGQDSTLGWQCLSLHSASRSESLGQSSAARVPHFPHSTGCQVLLILFPKCFSNFLCFTVAVFSQAIIVMARTIAMSSPPSSAQVTYLITWLPSSEFLHGSSLRPRIRPKLTPQHVILVPASAPASFSLTSVHYWT